MARVHVEPVLERLHHRADVARRVLQRIAVLRLERRIAHPAHHGVEILARDRPVRRTAQHVAARHVDVVLEVDRHRHRRERLVERSVERLDPRDARRETALEHDDLVADFEHTARDLPRVTAVVVVLLTLCLRPHDPLHGEAHVDQVAIRRDVHALQLMEQRRALVPRRFFAAKGDVVAVQRAHRDERHVGDVHARGETAQLGLDATEDVLVPTDEVHLVDREDDVRDAQQRRDQRVAARLLDDPLPRVDENDGQVRRRSARHHVARVLDVTRRVRDDELAPRRREVAVGDVDRDALFALGAQAVGEERQVRVLVAASTRHVFHVRELVLEDRFRVVEQAPDQGALAVVDAAARRKAQQFRARFHRGELGGRLRHQKYPSFFLSSIAASVWRSSARVAPRSV